MSDLTAAATLYGAAPDSFESLGAFESDVYRYDGPHGPAVLKVMAPGHRTPQQVQGEVDWLLALIEAGVSVSRPLPSVTGRWVEELDDGSVLVAFAEAPGSLVKPADWTEARIEAWGELLGRLQAHGRSWTPTGPRRQTLLEHTYLTRSAEFVADDPDFVRASEELARAATEVLSEGADSGLIHADLHGGNLLMHDESWTAIDFDDCGYGAFAFDLAMPIYYAVRSQRDAEPAEAGARFVPPFMRGFRRHSPDPAGGVDAIALSMMVRDAELVTVLRAKLKAEDWNDRMREIESRLRTRVKAGAPVLEPELLERWLG